MPPRPAQYQNKNAKYYQCNFANKLHSTYYHTSRFLDMPCPILFLFLWWGYEEMRVHSNWSWHSWPSSGPSWLINPLRGGRVCQKHWSVTS